MRLVLVPSRYRKNSSVSVLHSCILRLRWVQEWTLLCAPARSKYRLNQIFLRDHIVWWFTLDLAMKKKTILVTAASRGLGFSVAQSLVKEGATVIICSRTEKSLQEAVESLGPSSKYVIADVSKPEDILTLVEQVSDSTSHLDGLFVNAGGPPPGEFSDISDSEWRESFELTLMSAVRLTREFLPLLKKSKDASILYSTSISVKQPIPNLLLSNALRPAVIGMMRTLADEIGPDGIRVNAICPGYIQTDRVTQLFEASTDSSLKANLISQIPLGRIGSPNEFGAVCTFLLSPIASYIHGALLLVDGGLYRGMM
ncbi:MAG: SDR family oxidoreductase [Candidatus Lokiarchaeota archaeon]|nr:SDR family oxidoreductase [Candidatus Lokiarchaeota archaeon]